MTIVTGLAISGGVDSMALAHLSSQLQRATLPLHLQRGVGSRYKFQAFVVDHHARPESTDEALAVVDRLQGMGLKAEKLDIKPEAFSKDSHSFETVARKERFRTLGQACRRHGIKQLLLAHHADDRAETVLARIVGGYTGVGLAAIKTESGIPECKELKDVSCLGVQDMELEDEVRGMLQKQESHLATSETEGSSHDTKDEISREWTAAKTRRMPPQPAELGVTLHHPLLGFSKTELEATCIQNGVQWFEDATNKNEQLTIRNTVRCVLASDRFPEALKTPRLLHLHDMVNRSVHRYKNLAAQLIAATPIRSFDTRSGVLVIGIPLRQIRKLESQEPHAFTKVMETWLGYWAETVSPKVKADAFERVSDDLVHLVVDAEPTILKSVLGNICWQRFNHQQEHEPSLMLRRQPFPKSEPDPVCHWSPADSQRSRESHHHHDTWRLWDGRFWIQLVPREKRPFLCRALTSDDLATFKTTKSRPWLAALNRQLKEIGPNDVRFSSLPVVVDGTSNIAISLPTLGMQTVPAETSLAGIDVRYKSLPDQLLSWLEDQAYTSRSELRTRRIQYSKFR